VELMSNRYKGVAAAKMPAAVAGFGIEVRSSVGDSPRIGQAQLLRSMIMGAVTV